MTVYDRRQSQLWQRGCNCAELREDCENRPDPLEEPEDAKIWLDGYNEGLARRRVREESSTAR